MTGMSTRQLVSSLKLKSRVQYKRKITYLLEGRSVSLYVEKMWLQQY